MLNDFICELKRLLISYLKTKDLSPIIFMAGNEEFKAKCEFTFFPLQVNPSLTIIIEKFNIKIYDSVLSIQLYINIDFIETPLINENVWILDYPKEYDYTIIINQFCKDWNKCK